LVLFYPVGQSYVVRRHQPWWKFWVLRKFKVVQRWDFNHPFLGFTKRQALKFVAARHSGDITNAR
jgi:hypothetical protein